MSKLSLADVYAAASAIRGSVLRTPLVPSAMPADCDILLKLETLQPGGAFKLRGATNALQRLDAEARRRGVVCCSTGNHGRAVAFASRAMGIAATVCLSELVPDNKVRAVESLGARVLRAGASQDQAQAAADRLVAEEGLTDIPPFDHPHVIAGQGTIGLELLDDRPDLEHIVIPLSGGGLAGGIALTAKTIKPSIRITGISMARGAAMAAALEAGRPVEVEEVPTLADSLGGGIGLDNRYTYDLCARHLDEVILLSEAEIHSGMQALFHTDRLVGEGAAAVAHGALVAGSLRCDGPTAFIISGGNVEMERFTRIAAGQRVRVGDIEVGGEDDA